MSENDVCISTARDNHEFRCICRQLVAKLGSDGVEIKCKRCKRVVMIPFSDVRSGRPMTDRT